jgi:ketosteroid isomerase-like protein
MRNHRNVLGVLGLALAGCSSETVAPPPAAPVNWQSLEVHPVVDAGRDIVSAKERALPDVYASALASPGFAELGPLLDDEAHFAAPGMDDAHGPGPIVHAHDVLLGAFDGRKVTTTRVWRTAAEQTIEWAMTGTQARNWMGVAATQKPVTFRALTLLWTKDDGSITDVHVYINVAVVKAQLGVGPKDLLALPSPLFPTGPAQVFEQTQAASADEPRNVATAKSSLDALENNKESEYVDAAVDDLEVNVVERPLPTRGKDALRAYYKAMHKAIGQLDTTVDNAWGVGQFAIVEYSIDGEQLAPIGWVPAQRDKVVRMELVDICEMAGGKIARVWRYDNPT